jgi:hypothetical protein
VQHSGAADVPEWHWFSKHAHGGARLSCQNCQPAFSVPRNRSAIARHGYHYVVQAVPEKLAEVMLDQWYTTYRHEWFGYVDTGRTHACATAAGHQQRYSCHIAEIVTYV